MSVSPVQYGPNTPFTPEERATIEAIYNCVKESGHPETANLKHTIRQQMACLEWLGETLSQYPSPLSEQRLGSRQRGLATLVETLSRSNPANFDVFVPTRALLGRALDMAESNFYRLLRHVCSEVLSDETSRHFQEEATRRFHICLYTRAVEEILSAIACDSEAHCPIREQAVLALAQIWEHRLTYSVRDFFPILEATWQARARITVVGGTLAGTQEIFELFQHGCDPQFVDYFSCAHPSDDEIGAFREFLFGTSAEELDRLEKRMVDTGTGSITLDDLTGAARDDPTIAFYEFFRSRHLLAGARSLAHLPGPKRTAEGYVMISYLRQMEGETGE
ncbi:MAG: hypothetical protein KAV82_07265 [Phycisphaerae bacterium]|nr:hypothetical protein [Phycisphaerae bacterium]